MSILNPEQEIPFMTNDTLNTPIHPQTGPRTPSGKAASSRNALKDGLFAVHDFIRLGERDEYDAFVAAFRDQLAPEGPLEELFTTEIIGTNWRLRRCRFVEEELSAKFDIDPLQDDEGEKIQRSVDRARAQAQNAIRRALAEIRKLQTERHIRAELRVAQNYGIADFPKVASVLSKHGLRYNPHLEVVPEPEPIQRQDDNSFCKTAPRATSPAPEPNSFCNPPQSTPEAATENRPAASGLTPRGAETDFPEAA